MYSHNKPSIGNEAVLVQFYYQQLRTRGLGQVTDGVEADKVRPACISQEEDWQNNKYWESAEIPQPELSPALPSPSLVTLDKTAASSRPHWLHPHSGIRIMLLLQGCSEKGQLRSEMYLIQLPAHRKHPTSVGSY